jgi:hypothetical protein
LFRSMGYELSSRFLARPWLKTRYKNVESFMLPVAKGHIFCAVQKHKEGLDAVSSLLLTIN